MDFILLKKKGGMLFLEWLFFTSGPVELVPNEPSSGEFIFSAVSLAFHTKQVNYLFFFFIFYSCLCGYPTYEKGSRFDCSFSFPPSHNAALFLCNSVFINNLCKHPNSRLRRGNSFSRAKFTSGGSPRHRCSPRGTGADSCPT